MPPDSPWLDVNYPKLFWTPKEGLTGGGYLALIRQLSYEDALEPPPYAAAITLDGQISTSGTRHLTLDARFPRLFPGWRMALTLSGSRGNRENYFSIGNSTTYDEAFVTDAQEHFYRSRDARMLARGEMQRHIVSGLRVLVGFHLERWRVEPLEPNSLIALDAAAQLDPTIGSNVSDITVRGGLVFDTRDDEVAANRGVLLEFIHGTTAGGDLTYTRTTGSAAGYVPVGENLVLGARAVGQAMGGTPRLGSYYLVEASDRPYTGVGGGLSHRGLMENRLLGRHKLLFNIDARYHLVNLPRTARLTLMAFVDAARVFENQPFALTTADLKVGGGVGVYAQLARAGILGMTVGRGPDGIVVDVTTKWTY
jgi:outer membrane protein assembly factor BamA